MPFDLHLLENPFHLLGACTLDSSAELARRAARRGLQIGDAAAALALATLLDPARRLAAEVSWLPRVHPSRTVRVVRLILTDPVSDLPLHGMSALARANASSTQLVFGRARLRPDQVLRRLRTLADSAAAIDAREVLADIDADRAEAGFPRVADEGALREAVEGRRHFLFGAAIGVLVAQGRVA